MTENWIQDAIKKPGSLRKQLHIKEGRNIPSNALEKAAHSHNPLLRKRATLAQTFKRFHRRSPK